MHTKTTYAGWGLSGIVSLMLLMSAGMKLRGGAELAAMLTDKFGYPAHLALPLGLLEGGIVLLYAYGRTRVLGGLLLTGYLGGAVATHLRIGEAFVAPVMLGVLAWLGLWLRDPQLRALLPLMARGAPAAKPC